MNKKKDLTNKKHMQDAIEGPNKTFIQNNDKPNGEIKLVFRRHSNGKTILARQYSKVPMQVLKPHYYDVDGTAFVYSLNPAGGILQHDYLLTQIESEAGTDAVFTTPGNNKYYKMDEGCARIVNKILVRRGGVLEYLPEHNVPFAKSTTFQENEFRVESGAVLFAVDMLTSGRAANGERFEYDLYQSRTKIYINNELALYDNCSMNPKEEKLLQMGLLEGRLTNGSMYVYVEDMDANLKNQISSLSTDKVTLAAGNIRDDLMVVRFIGNEIIEMSAMVQKVWDVCRRSILGKPAVHLRKEFSAVRW